MKFIDLFSGIGGFRSALELSGHECIAYSEIDKFAIQSYKAIYDTENEIDLGDITEISQEYLSRFKEENDIVVGGSPCQSFSKDGKRKGFEDVRGTLFFEFAKVVKETQPRYFLFENVYGLMNHDKGNTIRVILNTFNELGYYVDFNVFNSKYYDVPQNRERIYIVGKRKDLVSSPNYHVLSKGKRKIDELHNWCLDNVDYIHLLPTPKSRINTKLLNILESDVSDKYLLPENIHEKLILHHNKEEDLLHVKQATKQGYDVATKGDSVNISFPNSKTRRGRVGKQVAQTLQAGAVNQCVVVGGDFDDKEIERDTFKILQALQKEIGEKEIAKWRSRILDTFQQEEILRQDVYEKGLDIKQNKEKLERNQQSHECEVKNTTFDKQERMREMPINKEFRCSSHGRESIQQFARELTSVMQKLSHETSQEKNLYRLRETTQGIRLLQQALYKIQEVWESSLHKKQDVRIRKLTEKECWRLQGFTDEQFYKAKDSGVSDNQLYKQAGNSVTVNVVDAIVKELK